MKRKSYTYLPDLARVILILFRRPDFVAVLGVLSRAEVEDYVARTKVARDARKTRYPQYAGSPPINQPSWTPASGVQFNDPSRPVGTQVKGTTEDKDKRKATAANLDCVAASLLKVLSEAAEGL
jgi:hypothetical protein